MFPFSLLHLILIRCIATTNMQKGTIASEPNPKGFGFIKIEGADDLFFHSNNLVNVRFEDLRAGDTLEFDVAPSERDANKKMAINVSKV